MERWSIAHTLYTIEEFTVQTTRRQQNQVDRLKLSEGGGVDALAGGLGTFAQHLCRLIATEATTPLTALILVLVRAGERNVRNGRNTGRQVLTS